MKPHIWTMSKEDAHVETLKVLSGLPLTILPHCKHCGITTYKAKIEQPPAGVGPCPKAP